MTEKDTEQSDPNPEDGEGQAEGVTESIGDWVAKTRRGRHESRAQRRWRKRHTAYQPEVEQVRVEKGALEELGSLFEDLGGAEEQGQSEESNEAQEASVAPIAFGKNDSAEIQVTVSTQGEQAVVDYLSLDVDEPIPGIEEVRQVLEWNFGVVHGIDDEAINKLLERAHVKGLVTEGGLSRGRRLAKPEKTAGSIFHS